MQRDSNKTTSNLESKATSVEVVACAIVVLSFFDQFIGETGDNITNLSENRLRHALFLPNFWT